MTEHQGDALSQDLVRQRPGLAGHVHYVNGQAWCDGINHTTMCGDDFSDEAGTTEEDDLAGQLADAGRGSELAADPLILSPDEFTALKTVAAVLYRLTGDASLESRTRWCPRCGRIVPELLMRLGEALCPSCWDAAESPAADPLILSPDEFAALKTVARIEGICRDVKASSPPFVPVPVLAVDVILGIIGSEGEPGHG